MAINGWYESPNKHIPNQEPLPRISLIDPRATMARINPRLMPSASRIEENKIETSISMGLADVFLMNISTS